MSKLAIDCVCLYLAGKQMSTVRDSICTLLWAQEVSTADVSNKIGMLSRVLVHGSYSETWWVRLAESHSRLSPDVHTFDVIQLSGHQHPQLQPPVLPTS